MSESADTTDAPLAEAPVGRSTMVVLAATLTLGPIGWALDLYRTLGLTFFNEQFLGAALGVGLAILYLRFPFRLGAPRPRVPWYDYVLAAVGFAAGWYVAIFYPRLNFSIDAATTPLDALALAIALYVLCLEGLRRTAGYSLVVIVLIFSVWALIGDRIKGPLETTPVEWDRFLTYLAIDTTALLGLPMAIAVMVVIPFIFFGQLLLKSGGSNFFSDISLAIMGRFRGGSAKIAIMASALFGSISGVAVSNIVATGVITIPLMKRGGFQPRLAAAIEAVASTGGQLMPPVMGATAFLMADFLQRPYRDIVIAALVPSLLYYLALFIQADLISARHGIKRVEPDLIPRAGPVLARGGVFLAPFAALIFALFWLNWRPETAAILGAGIVLVIGFTTGYGDARMRLADLWDALVETGISVADVLMIVAAAGFLMGLLQVTGLGFALTTLLVKLGAGNIVLLLIIAGVLCIILGMGMPTLGVYVLLAVLVAPALIEVGVPELAAHLFILYLGMMSMLTPPVAVAAFFAANIARAPAMQTGWTAMQFGWTAYVVPFLFVFAPSLLLEGSPLDVAWAIVTATAGIWLVSTGIVGVMFGRIGPMMRVLATIAGILLLIPHEIAGWGWWTDLLGAVLALGLCALLWSQASSGEVRESEAR